MMDDRAFWIGIRRALLDIVRLIEQRHGVKEAKPPTH